ncbi:MAG: EamA family transporter, partial [Thiohalomonadales bacterium]
MATPQTELILPKQNQSIGYFLGFLAVAAFSATLPATRIAVHYFDPSWVGLGRSLLASIPALLLLAVARQALPTRHQFVRLGVVAAGVVIGFPLFSSWAMQALPAAHAG